MAKRKYRLRYLPLFEKDIAGVKNYIVNTLQSPAAGEKLVVETEKAILKRLSAPLSHKAYPSKKDRKHLYYRIHVGGSGRPASQVFSEFCEAKLHTSFAGLERRGAGDRPVYTVPL